MTQGTDRRSVLTGLGALGLGACSPVNRSSGVRFGGELDLSALERRYKGRLGLWASTELADVFWRGEERFLYCSSFKLFLAAEVLKRVVAGREQLDRAIPVVQADMLSHAPVTEPAIGKSLSIETLCQAVVEVSDNPAANILLREIGGLEAMRAFYDSLGDQVTRVDRWEPELNRRDGDKDTTAPNTTVGNLVKLFADQQPVLSWEMQERLTNWMVASPTGPGRIKAGTPEGWRVAHKTGTGGYGPTIDIGRLYPPRGSRAEDRSGGVATLAVYFDGAEGSTPDGREAAIAEATRRALAALDLTGPA